VIASVLFGGVIVYGLVIEYDEEPTFNNGTHTFGPTVIFISLDGVVNHDLGLHVTPVLSQLGRFISETVKPSQEVLIYAM
jgi:hypothetical protein